MLAFLSFCLTFSQWQRKLLLLQGQLLTSLQCLLETREKGFEFVTRTELAHVRLEPNGYGKIRISQLRVARSQRATKRVLC